MQYVPFSVLEYFTPSTLAAIVAELGQSCCSHRKESQLEFIKAARDVLIANVGEDEAKVLIEAEEAVL